MPRFALSFGLLSCLVSVASGQRPVPYPVTPPAEFQRAMARGTRTTTGEAGLQYWQQWTDYTLFASIEPAAKRVTGRAQIRYHNRSPFELPVVFLQLPQNLHASGAVRLEPQEVTGGMEITRIVASGQTLSDQPMDRGAAYEVFGTTLAVRPPAPVGPGGLLNLEIEWAFTVPQSGAGRMGWSGDDLFHIAYWYPQMAVFDDVVGWQTDGYTGNAEFYAGFGSYALTVEAPAGWVVAATGRLENAAEVLPEPVWDRLARAERSDTVVHVLTAEDFGPGKATATGTGGRLRWRFSADTVRDVAFSVMRGSRWDATRTPVGDRDGDGSTDYATIHSFWRPSATLWQHAWRYGQHSIDFLSRWTGLPYPWPHMTIVEGGGIIGGGMEFPMMTLIGDYNDREDADLYNVVAHELAHMWVPMQIGSDERRYAWMDEGTTTFNENRARAEFRLGDQADAEERDNYLGAARQQLEGELMRWSDYHYPGPAYGIASYQKPATLLVTLRGLLGEETFVRAYREYLSRWRYRHPKPWDFFNTFNSVSGKNLDWFWRTWYYETWTLDQAIVSVTPGTDGTTIVVEDRGLAPMPVRLTITRTDGTTEEQEIPVDAWLKGATRAEVLVVGRLGVTAVEIDAAGVFPDVDRGNNRWVAVAR
ncbi:MAG: M1 family metallopeptidase [Gemmatimonadota bacterium]|nr:M1 family metallopeptidase [Gemmatimonadota bacterium]